MIVCKTIEHVRRELKALKKEDKKMGLVPTMGALHQGHIELMKIAAKHSDAVVVSIFVNPTQFGPNEDFDTYPRQLQQDLDACRDQNVSIVFAPEHDEMYNNQNYFSIQIDSLNQYMCGGSRPGFFKGVCLVVNKLFNIIKPDLAVFGQKDIQQFLILKRMTKEFNHPVEMIMAPIVRANDGLALSSRNAYLSDHERMIAPGLFRSLQYLQKQIEGGVITPKLLIEHQKNELEAKGFKIDYLNVFSRATLQPVKTLTEQTKYLIAGAVWLGTTRLIDNILIEI
ncbi:MAG: pantoate--beta-alanine ligase [Balneolaceae bacterium]